MKKMRAQWLTVHKREIDQNTSIEILWQTAPNTLHVLICGARQNQSGFTRLK